MALASLSKDLLLRLTRGLEPPYMMLSPRERQVAALAAGGATAKEIGDRLFVTLPTVRTHLRHAYEKLGVRGQTEALLALLEIGILHRDQVHRFHAEPVAAA